MSEKGKELEVSEETKEIQQIDDTQNVIQNYNKMKQVATDLFQSKLFTHLNNPQQALAVVEYGRELGVPPMKALTQMAVIRGKISTSSQLMLALAKKNGCNYKIVEHTKDKCVIDFRDPQGETHRVQFTYEEAKNLGLAKRDNWKKQRKNMLYWRCIAKAVRRHAPDTLLGIYTIEEMTEGEATTIEEYEEIDDADYETVEDTSDEKELPIDEENIEKVFTKKELQKAYKKENWDEEDIEKFANRKEERMHIFFTLANWNIENIHPEVVKKVRLYKDRHSDEDWNLLKSGVLDTDDFRDADNQKRINMINDLEEREE